MQRSDRRGWRWWGLVASGLLALLPLLSRPPDPTPLIYAAFVLILLLRGSAPQPARPARFALAIVAAGLVLEMLAWLSNFLKCSPAPAMMHPQLAPDLVLGLGFYGAWAAAWLLLLRRYRFTPAQIFVTQGLFGVVVEQQGAVLVAGLASFPLGLLLWLYVFAVYGSVAGIAALLAGVPGGGQRSTRWRFPLALVVLAAVLWPLSFGWGAAARASGLVAAPAPICERPLW